jgi:hypothetical protein
VATTMITSTESKKGISWVALQKLSTEERHLINWIRRQKECSLLKDLL